MEAASSCTSPQPVTAEPEVPPFDGLGGAESADLLALGRAAVEAVHRALRSSPEVRESRVHSRGPIDLEDLLLEIDVTAAETPWEDLIARLGVSLAPLRSTALRLQRMSLVRVSDVGVGLTAQGRQKVGRLEAARAAALRRLASGIARPLTEDEGRHLRICLGLLLEGAEAVLALSPDETEPSPLLRGGRRAARALRVDRSGA